LFIKLELILCQRAAVLVNQKFVPRIRPHL
jgi:hypothetical protein